MKPVFIFFCIFMLTISFTLSLQGTARLKTGKFLYFLRYPNQRAHK